MSNIPSAPEEADFVARLLRATRTASIKWEAGEAPNCLKADLGDGYTAKLIRVEDFDGLPDEEDYVVGLENENKWLFSIDRRVVGGEELSKALGETVQYSHAVFSELWRRAFLKSRRITEHLSKVNRLLAVRIGKDE